MWKPLTGKNHGRENEREEEIHYNSLVARSIMIWKEFTNIEFSGFDPLSHWGRGLFISH